MKHFPIKTNVYDRKEWYKHVKETERKINALYEFIQFNNPNYWILNSVDYEVKTPFQYMQTKCWNQNGNIIDVFLKEFNNHDILWATKEMNFYNSYIEDKSCIPFTVTENSWLIIDNQEESGYQLQPSTSGFGMNYTMHWTKDSEGYKITYSLTPNVENYIDHFFLNPFQSRWNYNINFTSKQLIIDNKNIVSYKKGNQASTSSLKEYFRNDKLVMNQILYKNNENEIEEIFIDTTYRNQSTAKRQIITIKSNINPNFLNKLEVHYW